MKKIRHLYLKGGVILSKILLLIFMFSIFSVGESQTKNILKAEYFIDTDPGFGLAASISITTGNDININTLIPLTNVQTGIHTIYFRVKDDNGKWSLSQNIPFYRLPRISENKIVLMEYFIDTDPGFGKGNNVIINPSNDITKIFNVDLKNTLEGLHTLYIRAKDKTGKWSLCQIMPFNSKRSYLQQQIAQIEYFLDKDPGFGKGTLIPVTPSSDINTLFNIPLTNAANGFHILYLRSQDKDSKWSLCQTMPFVKLQNPINNNKITDIEYFWDTDPGFGSGTGINITTPSTNIEFPFIIDVKSLSAGQHTIYVRVKDMNNNWSLVYTQTLNLGNINGIITYDNSSNTKLGNIKIYLDTEGELIDSTMTDINGNYNFSNLPEGNYTISIAINKKTGGIDPVDALFVNRNFVKLYTFPDNLRKNAADVNSDNKTNPIDALFINRYFVKLITSFAAGKWYFEPLNFTMNGANQTLNIKGICIGDVNGSHKP
jgi:hypothetical protein